jgi:putative hemolysin
VVAEIGLVLTFVVVGGVFAAAEIALVSLRSGQVSRLAATHRRGAVVARLTDDPNRFLSAAQIGITLAGFLSSAVGAVTLAEPLGMALRSVGFSAPAAATASVVGVTVVIAYVSLVVGELSPKRIALQRAEPIALLAAAPLDAIARLARPVIWLLRVSSDVVVRLFGVDPAASRQAVGEAELRDMVATSAELSHDERRLIAQVLDAGDRPLREIMVPRLDVSALEAGMSVEEALRLVEGQPHSRYPVVEGGLDDATGFIHVRDLFSARARTEPSTSLRGLSRPLMRLPDSRRALPTLAEMRREGVHLALVVDEYGGGAGIVTLEDLLEELVGDITDEFDTDRGGHGSARGAGHPRDASGPDDTGRRALPDGPVDAQLRLEEFGEETGVELPDGPYDTAAGWMLHVLGRIPDEGDSARFGDVVLTVSQLRGRRVEQVVLARVPAETPTDRPTEDGTGADARVSAPGEG